MTTSRLLARGALRLALGLCVWVGLSCRAEEASSKPEPGAPASRAEGRPVPAELRGERFVAEFAVYLLEKSPGDLAGLVRERARSAIPYATLVSDPSIEPTSPAILIREPSIAEYAPPDLEGLQYFGIGISPEQGAALQRSPGVIALSFAAGGDDRDRLHRDGLKLVHALASELGGLPWDEDTRQIYSREAWKERRLDTLGEVLDLRYHVTLHAYRDGDLIRIVTLGMRKFALPDVVANDVPAHLSEAMGNLINLVCQTLQESSRISAESSLTVDIAKLASASMREAQQASTQEGGTGRATVSLQIAEPEEGDADNRLIELRFTDTGTTAQIRQAELLGQLYGSADAILAADSDDPELERASERARAAFFKLKDRIQLGRKEREHFQVKAPFDVPGGGVEYMWVEVLRWEGDTLVGILQSDPRYIPDLKSGAEVAVEVDSIFDYIHRLPSGEVIGNETTAIIERQQPATRLTK
jgi:uncharacterized protein YegJ (DUF2314 family)